MRGDCGKVNYRVNVSKLKFNLDTFVNTDPQTCPPAYHLNVMPPVGMLI